MGVKLIHINDLKEHIEEKSEGVYIYVCGSSPKDRSISSLRPSKELLKEYKEGVISKDAFEELYEEELESDIISSNLMVLCDYLINNVRVDKPHYIVYGIDPDDKLYLHVLMALIDRNTGVKFIK